MNYDRFLERLDAKLYAKETDHPPLKYVVLFALVIAAICKLWIFPAWDAQMQQMFDQQEAYRVAQCKAGVMTEDGDCHPLRNRK